MTDRSTDDSFDKRVTIDNAAAWFGARTQADIDMLAALYEELRSADALRYRAASPSEHDALVAQINEVIASDKTSVAGEHRQEAWERGWGETLADFVASDFDLKSLRPYYFKRYAPARLNNTFIFPKDEMMVFEYYLLFLRWLFKKYLAPFSNLAEIGCGTGINLLLMNQLFPQKKLWGYDWASPSVEILNHLSQRLGKPITGGVYNFFGPADQIQLPPDSCVLTITALEQVGSRFDKFLNLLLEQKPALVVNVEPINEFYDRNCPMELLSLKYHEKRNYLWNYYSTLTALQDAGKIEIFDSFHHRFGHMYNHSASYIVWKPL